MAKKTKSKKPAKLKSSPTAKSSAVGIGITAGKKLLGMGGSSSKSKGGFKRRKKSAIWYAKEIQRMKLKKRYEKIKIGIVR